MIKNRFNYFVILTMFILSVVLLDKSIAAQYRIISLAPNTTEILFKLGLGDQIVGVDEYSNYPEDVKLIEKAGTFSQPNIEKIILLRPDFILLNTDIEAYKQNYLKERGISIIKISPKNMDELCSDIERVARLFGKIEEAKIITSDITRRIKSINASAGKNKPKVFVHLFDEPLTTVSFFISGLIHLAGGENIAYDVNNDSGIFSYEALIERNPDIILSIGFAGSDKFPSSINAVKNKRIYSNLDPDILLRPGPRAIEAIEELNRIFYKDR